MDIKTAIGQLAEGRNLSRVDTRAVTNEIMSA